MIKQQIPSIVYLKKNKKILEDEWGLMVDDVADLRGNENSSRHFKL